MTDVREENVGGAPPPWSSIGTTRLIWHFCKRKMNNIDCRVFVAWNTIRFSIISFWNNKLSSIPTTSVRRIWYVCWAYISHQPMIVQLCLVCEMKAQLLLIHSTYQTQLNYQNLWRSTIFNMTTLALKLLIGTKYVHLLRTEGHKNLKGVLRVEVVGTILELMLSNKFCKSEGLWCTATN